MNAKVKEKLKKFKPEEMQAYTTVAAAINESIDEGDYELDGRLPCLLTTSTGVICVNCKTLKEVPCPGK